jgi:hypothetical protein
MMNRCGLGLITSLLLAVLATPLASQPLPSEGRRGSLAPLSPGPLLLIVDIHADPFGTGGTPGALFLANPRTGKVVPVASDPAWQCPVWVEPRDKVWLVVDFCQGTVLRATRQPLDQGGLVNSTVLFSSPLVAPVAWYELPAGDRLIADSRADPLGLGVSTGAVFLSRGTPPSPLQTFLAGPELKAPAGFARDPAGRHFLLDADARPINHPGLGEGAVYQFDGHANLTLAAAPVDGFSPLQCFFVPLDGTDDEGDLILVDANAGLLTTPFPTGKIFSMDLSQPWPVTANTVISESPLLADPTGGVYEGPNKILVADMNADPLGLGYDGVGLGYSTFGRGAIYRVDLRTGQLTVAVASPMFVNPTQMVWLDDAQVQQAGLRTVVR